MSVTKHPGNSMVLHYLEGLMPHCLQDGWPLADSDVVADAVDG